MKRTSGTGQTGALTCPVGQPLQQRGDECNELVRMLAVLAQTGNEYEIRAQFFPANLQRPFAFMQFRQSGVLIAQCKARGGIDRSPEQLVWDSP